MSVVKPRVQVRTPRAPVPGTPRGDKSYGRGAPAPEHRETADEAEVTLRERVAAEAEAGEIRAHALSSPSSREGKGSVKAPVQGEGGDEVGKTNQKEQRKEVAIWDMKERETLLTGATVVKVTWDALVLEKQGKHIIVEANCYQCGFGHFIVTVRE